MSAGDPTLVPAPPARKSRTGLVIGLVAGIIALVLIAGAAAFVAPRIRRNQAVATPTATPSPTATTPKPVSPEEYQTALDQADQEIAPKYAAFVAAKHPSELNAAATALARTIGERVVVLGAVGPPVAVALAHQRMVAGLSAFGSAVSSAGNVTSGSMCAGPSAVAKVSQSSGAGRLRDAIAELATDDTSHAYKFGAYLPALTQDPNRSLPNGAKIKQANNSSSNRVTVKNQGSHDIVVSLVVGSSTTATLMFYVTAGQTATYIGIANANYDVWYTTGVDWDNDSKGFTRSCSYAHSSNQLLFDATGGSYITWTLTIGDLGGFREDPTGFPV